MPENSPELVTPVLLLAMPQVRDPFFHQSAVLLVHHNDEGSFGLIVNRPTEVQVDDVLTGMEIDWQGDPEALAYLGGPVMPQMGSVLYSDDGAPDPDDATAPTEAPVGPGIRLTHNVGRLTQLAQEPPAELRLFLGHAGWGPGQLMEEILRNDWLTAPADPTLVFAGEPETVWERALLSLGVDPATLPSWTRGGEDDGTN